MGSSSTAVISFAGLRFKGFHGVHAAEKTLGQIFEVDVEAWLDDNGEDAGAAVAEAADSIRRAVQGVVEGPSLNLVETVAEFIVANCFVACPKLSELRVRVMKPHVAVTTVQDYLGIEVRRRRSNPEYQEEDHLLLEGLVCHGYHGEKAQEKALGQKYRVSVRAWLPLSRAGLTDSPQGTVDYALISRLVEDTVARHPAVPTLHALAHLIALKTLDLSGLIRRTEVALTALQADYGITACAARSECK